MTHTTLMVNTGEGNRYVRGYAPGNKCIKYATTPGTVKGDELEEYRARFPLYTFEEVEVPTEFL
jgi:hypothetical protein